MAAERAFADAFRDDDPTVRRMVQRHASTLSGNPREIKRFINLLRFYSLIQVRRELRGLPTPTLEQVAKIAAIAIRWPELLTVLARNADDGPSAGTVLVGLERLATEASREKHPQQHWKKGLETIHLNHWAALTAATELRELLSQQPALGDSAVGFM